MYIFEETLDSGVSNWSHQSTEHNIEWSEIPLDRSRKDKRYSMPTAGSNCASSLRRRAFSLMDFSSTSGPSSCGLVSPEGASKTLSSTAAIVPSDSLRVARRAGQSTATEPAHGIFV